MIQRTPWFERRFDIELTVEALPALIERLRGTPARLEDRLGSLPEAVLTRRLGHSWSIQENVGHLLDLESVWQGRVDDFEAGSDTLRPADLENRKTHEANHNATPLVNLQASFRTSRSHLVARLECSDEEFARRSALHPRLKKPTRVLDLVFFVAEHDDHHLARITELIQMLGEKTGA